MASLKAAAEDKTNPNVSKVTSFAVDPRILEVREGFNARPLNQEHVEQMAVSYANGATFPPLDVEVEDGHIYPVDGHHRRAAALLAISRGAPIRSVECRQFRGNDADKVAHLITSASGLPLTPLQLGVQYRKLIGFGWTEKQVADRVGKSGQHVKDMIVLAEANSDVHQAVNAGEVSGTTAATLVKRHGSKAGKVIREVVEKAKASGKTKATPKMFAEAGESLPELKVMIEWHPVPGAKLPDAELTVLIDIAGEPFQGHLDGETWRDINGYPIPAVRVRHWAHCPATPSSHNKETTPK